MYKQIQFCSALAEDMQQFVAFKRMQGYEYSSQARTLRYFDQFLFAECGETNDSCLSLEVLTDYVGTLAHLKAFSRRAGLSSVREFSRYLHARCPRSAVLPGEVARLGHQPIRFYRIEAEQMTAMMAASAIILRNVISRQAIHMLIGLLYCTGLRIREALSLTLGDLDLQRSMLHVVRGKFAKQRLVPLSPSTLAALKAYLSVRRNYAGTGTSCALFIGAHDQALSYDQAHRAFRRLCTHCGLDDKPPPRLHDLRHNFACRRLVLWREQGKDVNAMLPVLATLMGHVNIFHTQTYLHIEPSDLHQAAGLLQARLQTNSENQS